MTCEPAVGAALAAFREANGLCHGERTARRWIVRAGHFAFPLPNFEWRRRAIDAHDVHHMITGYPCTVAGELRIAAWEFGAGRFPHWGATLFCAPLVLIGLFWMPKAIWSAWRLGRRQRTLYDPEVLGRLLTMPLAEACSIVGSPQVSRLAPGTTPKEVRCSLNSR